MFIDSHCHLYLKGLVKDISAVIERALEAGVNKIICVGIDLETSNKVLEIVEKYDPVFGSAGIHPSEVKKVPTNYIKEIENILKHPKMLAVGEIGLDYYWDTSFKDEQIKIFKEQIELAQNLKLPIIFHNRNADKDMVDIMTKTQPVPGVAHCFSSDLATAKRFLELGLYISFAGNLTYKNSILPGIAKEIPLERILIETDAPFLSPVPFRGKENEPARARLVAEKLSEIKNTPLDEIATILSGNTQALFKISD